MVTILFLLINSSEFDVVKREIVPFMALNFWIFKWKYILSLLPIGNEFINFHLD